MEIKMKEMWKTREIIKGFFNNAEGNPFELTSGQVEIFNAVFDPTINRVAIKATTQYGKSEAVSLALIMSLMDRPIKILIVAPMAEQAKIIMSYLIQHLFDNELFVKAIEYEIGGLERLQRERSKTRITFTNGSEVFILTANVKELAKESKNLMGFGADMVVVDESSLIPDSMFSKIIRMIGGVKNGKLVQLGNPFENNHFGRAFESPRYLKISIDWRQALAEGRLTQEFLDEARETLSELDWIIFYECKFPEAGAEDALISRAWVENAVNQKGCNGDHKQSGLDVARFGRDKTIYVFRKGGEVLKIDQTEKMDTMEVTGWVTERLQNDAPDVHCTDSIGVGAGVHDRLVELQGSDNNDKWVDTEIVPVNVGEAPVGWDGETEAKERFFNLRAQIYWNLRALFKPDKDGHSQISIPNDPELKKQLEEIRYKYSSERKIKIEAKEDMKKRLGVSPDKADALSLAFLNTVSSEPQIMIADV